MSIVAATTGACCAFVVARWIAHDAVEELAGPRVQGWQAWIERRGFMAVFYARITPAMPYNIVNYVAGLTRVSLGAFAAATAVGAAPRAFAYTALGGSFGDFSSPETIIAIVVLVGDGRRRRLVRLARRAAPARRGPAPNRDRRRGYSF